jgi:hypothetical protein
MQTPTCAKGKGHGCQWDGWAVDVVVDVVEGERREEGERRRERNGAHVRDSGLRDEAQEGKEGKEGDMTGWSLER